MKLQSLLSLVVAISLLSGCDSEIDDLESQRPVSNVATTEADGVVTATISATATTPQTVVASQNSKVADASVTFAPGSLAVNTDITLGEAKDQSAQILTSLGVSGVVDKGVPVVVGPKDPATQVNVSAPLTIQLPLPIDKLIAPAGLTTASAKLVLIYTIYQNGWKSGILPLTSQSLIGAFLNEKFSGMGYFQIVGLAVTTEKNEIDSQIVPELGSSTETETETVNQGDDPTAALADYAGFYSGTVTEVKNTDEADVNGNKKYCAITSDNFKVYLSNYLVFTWKVSTPAPASTTAAFDGDVASVGEITGQDPSTISAKVKSYPGAAVLVDEGVYNSGVKYSPADRGSSRALEFNISGAFSGTRSKKFTGTFIAAINATTVCEYTLTLSKN